MRKLLVSCFAFIALASASGCGEDGPLKVVPDRQGGRGESCLVTNDCKSGLLCITDRCIDEDFALEATAKVCVQAQCIDKKDCCPPKSKAEKEQCNLLEQACATNPGGFECQQFATDCGACTAECTNHSCVFATETGPECTSAAECFGFEQYCVAGECVECQKAADCGGNSLCVDGTCAQCGKDADCGAGFVCEQSACIAGCIRDEQCGAMSACKSGRCEARNCLNNRECVAFIDRADAVCAETGTCSVPCDNNGGCVSLGGLFSCVEGYCKYAGCDTNAECAAASDDLGGGTLSLCLSQAEADKVTFGGF